MAEESNQAEVDVEITTSVVHAGDTDIIEELTHLREEEMIYEDTIKNKRNREQDNNEIWQNVERRHKKKKTDTNIANPQTEPAQICVTSKEVFPKQFALAKLLKVHNIQDISRVKYINPYKLLISFENDLSADNFCSCPDFGELGWRCQKTWEVGLSYGVIKDIDIGLPDEELINNIKSNFEIVAVKRLNRRSQDGWTPSESIKISFSGSSLPPYINLFDMKIKVEPYVFPVTQCSRCWRFGHVAKMCPSNKIICPKCSKTHANCDSNDYKCVNCSGNHMALSKTCPIYGKEKRLRELMSEYNCTYRRALTLYVPPSPMPVTVTECLQPTTTPQTFVDSVHLEPNNNQSYAEIASSNQKATPPKSSRKKRVPKRFKKNISSNTLGTEQPDFMQPSSDMEQEEEYQEDNNNSNNNYENAHNKSDTWKELLQKIKNIIVEKHNTIAEKIKCLASIFVDWCISIVLKYVSEMSVIKNFFSPQYG
ncbi:uncharacterized protein [Epargyreus clarus]|uniref:uncharacterized protein n=1 Tax=Epargyreus clarus TaxID=520877 RepID=UPI003C2E493E